MPQDYVNLAANQQYAQNVKGKFFAVISAQAPFAIEADSGGKQTMVQGSTFSGSFKRLTFFETQGAANQITFLVADAPAQVPVIASNPARIATSGVNSSTNPFTYAYFEPGAILTDPFTYTMPLRTEKPFRRVWSYFEADTFTWTFAFLSLEFYLKGVTVLNLPLRNTLDASPLQFGLAMNKAANNGNPAPQIGNQLWYRNGDGTGKVYVLNPFDCYIVADSCKIVKNEAGTGAINTNIRAILAVLSAEEKF